MTGPPMNRFAASVLTLAAAVQLGLAALHAHAAPGEPGLRAAAVPEARGPGDPAGAHERDACAVCKGLLQSRDLLAGPAAAAPATSAVRTLRPPLAEAGLRSAAPLSPAGARAPPSGS
jgi:hypothetical protein